MGPLHLLPATSPKAALGRPDEVQVRLEPSGSELPQAPIPSGYVAPHGESAPSKVGRASQVSAVREIPRLEGQYGVIADFDQTIAPAHNETPIPRPFPGIAALIHALQGDQISGRTNAGYTHYVTARTPDLSQPLPAYLAQHGLPTPGNLHIGSSTEHAPDQVKKKVSDIAKIIAKDPGRGFVLFGDSSHIDPLVFQKIKARFPTQVVAAIIHRVKDNVPAGGYEGLIVVDDYVDAAFALHQIGVVAKTTARTVIECAQLEGAHLQAAQKHQFEDLETR